MKEVYLTGRSATDFLLSPLVKGFDADFEARRAVTHSQYHFMAYLEDCIDFPCSVFVNDAAPSLTRAEAQSLSRAIGTPLPLHVSVATPRMRRDSQKLKCHLHPASAPASMYFNVEGELSCALPALALFETPVEDEVELIVLASIMFGVFTKNRETGKLVPRRKLTDPASVTRFLERCRESGERLAVGTARIERLVPHAVVNAASPKEIETALCLGLPQCMGGCGYGKPCLNHELKVPASQKSRYCDLYWPEQNVCVEYDGEEEHTAPQALEEDAMRNNDLVALRVPIFRVTAGQLASTLKFNRVARQIGEALGAPVVPNTVAFHERQDALRRQIEAAFRKYGF